MAVAALDMAFTDCADMALARPLGVMALALALALGVMTALDLPLPGDFAMLAAMAQVQPTKQNTRTVPPRPGCEATCWVATLTMSRGMSLIKTGQYVQQLVG